MDITTSKKKEEYTRKKMFLDRITRNAVDCSSSSKHNKCFKRQQAQCSITTTKISKSSTILRNVVGQERVTKACCSTSTKSTTIQLLLFSLLVIQLSPLLTVARLTDRLTTSADFNQQQYHEISVQPGATVRIDCRLPTPPDNLEHHYWNFQQELPDASTKSYVLAFESKPVSDVVFGHQLETDPSAGVYDVVIGNVSTNNNGLYICDYKTDKQSMQKEIRLTVLIPPQPPVIISGSPAPAREGLEYQLSCLSQGGNPEPNITWFRNDQIVTSASGSVKIEQTRSNGTTNNTLTIVPTMDDNMATYKCSVWNKAMNVQAYEREIGLRVEYAPRINVGQFNPLKVLIGTQAILQCLVEANPPVKGIRWFKDGHLISNQYNHTISDVKISDSSVYSCQADNGIAPLFGSNSMSLNGQVVGPASSFLSLFGLTSSGASVNDQHKSASAVEAHLHLQVLYPPRVHVHPSKSSSLNEGDFFSLNCSVDSYPPAHEYVWTKLDDPGFRRTFSASQRGGSSLEFQSIMASDIGNYTCTASNRMEPSIANYPDQTVIERHSSGSALVLVNHKPGLAELFVGHNGKAELGAKTQLQCRAKPPGYPEPDYRFMKITQPLAGGQKLALTRATSLSSYTFMAVRAEDEGRYSCSATNAYGTSSDAEADLIVNELPTIIHDNSIKFNEDQRKVGDHPYSITVRATGKPKPEVTWYHRSLVDERRFDLGSSELQAKFKIETSYQPTKQQGAKFNVITTLTFRKPLEVEDRGLYSVEFNNGLSQSAVESLQLHINHSPIPMPANQPLLVNNNGQVQLKAGFNQGEQVNLVCRVSAHPKPMFVWYSSSSKETDKPIESNLRYRISDSNPRDDIWESTLSFPQANHDDYGDYLCSVANTDGQTDKYGDSVRILIHLTEKTIPETPSQLIPIDSNQDSITLQWLSGFDGGYAQTQYLVQYAPDDGSGSGPQLSKRFPNFDTKLATAMASSSSSAYAPVLDNIDLTPSQQQQALQIVNPTGKGYPKVFDCGSMNPCTINHLLPRQEYVFRVYAKNEAGPSDFSDEVHAKTRANNSQIPKILSASFDPHNNVLHFRIESGSDYPLISLSARIETRPSSGTQTNSIENSNGQQADELYPNSLPQPGSSGWRLNSTVPIIGENVEVHLAMPSDYELRLTLCSRANESLCGPELEVSMKSAATTFFEDRRGSPIYTILSTLTLMVLLVALATGVNSCCLSKKAKKADTIERVDGSIDNKPITNGSANGSLPNGVHKSSHGSTTSTNSTSANGTSTNGLQSMDSINGVLNAGTTSDHSSDHSRQAKLDSMLPPNYNHYADRASILMEQQKQQQQQMLMEQYQAGLMAGDKLAPSFGLPNSALLSVAGQQQQSLAQHHSPGLMDATNNSLGYFAYQSQLEAQQQSLADGGMMLGAAALEAPDAMSQQQQQQQQMQQAAMWPNQLDDYNNPYNALSYGNQAQEQMIDPAYGTTGAVMMSQHSAVYDNSANSGQFQSYMNAYQSSQVVDTPTSAAQYQQQRAQYQASVAVAQQQMYGTLTRNSYSSSGNNNISDINKSQQNTSSSQQLLDQQQQQQYNTTNGLNPAPQLTPLGQQQQPQESDYGTIGGRSGRLIREIIV